MYRLLSVICVVVLLRHGETSSLRNEVIEQCRDTYSAALNNDFLLGEWFEVMKYTYFGGLMPSGTCSNQVFYKATKEDLTAYEKAYDVTITMEDNPLLINRADYAINLVAGNVQAKDWYSQPTMPLVTVNAYKPLTDEYMLVQDCSQRGMTVWLYSRIRHPTNEEIAKVTEGLPELANLESQRFCWLF